VLPQLLDPNQRQVVLEPLTAAHAREMSRVLSDPAIYEFENSPPPSESALTERYRRLESRRSPDGREQWLNWVVRLPTGEAAGYVQATVPEASNPRLAQVAYELSSAHWRQGIGYAAVSAMMRELQEHQAVACFVAVLKMVNHRSIRLLTALGFRRSTLDEIAAFGADKASSLCPEDDECMMVRGRLAEPVSPSAGGFDYTPTLRGPNITLRGVQPLDLPALQSAAADPAIWTQHPSPKRYRPEVFKTEFWDSARTANAADAAGDAGARSGSESPLLLLAIDNRSGQVIGSSRFYDWNPQERSVAIGYTFLTISHWGGPTNAEVKRLMLEHAFQTARTVWFHIGADNWRSRRAIEKIGAALSHSVTREVQGQTQVVMHYRLDAPKMT
jgi:RimJ/RimL family protein N-acetyltransferase